MSKKTFLDYLAESHSVEYSYRIKTTVPLTDTELRKIENALDKYELLDMTRPKTTPIQDYPLDFKDVKNTEVHIVDIVLHIPASSYILQQELCNALDILEKFIVVRGDNEPIEIEAEDLIANANIANKMAKDDLNPDSLLSTNPVYQENDLFNVGKDYYGNEYNSKFLRHLADISATRETTKVEPADALFSWLDMPEQEKSELDDNTFNKDIKDAPVSVPYWKKTNRKEFDPLLNRLSQHGNFDDNEKVRFKNAVNPKNGKKKEIIDVNDPVRKN